MSVDRDPAHQTPAKRKAKQNRSFSAALSGMAATRCRRNSDWFFDSLRGLMVDEDGDPLAMVVNPEGVSTEMCTACLACFERRDYRALEVNDKDQRVCLCGAVAWTSHFATFPQAMVAPLIIASTSEHGVWRAVKPGSSGADHGGSRRGTEREPGNPDRRAAKGRD